MNKRSIHQRSESKIQGKDASFADAAQAARGIATSLGLEPAESAAQRRLIAAEGTVPPAVVAIAIEVGSEQGDVIGSHFDVTKVTTAQSRILAMQPLRAVLAGVLRQVDDEILRERGIVGTETRALYRYLQAIAGTPRGSSILEPLDRMTAAMKKPHHRKPKAPTPAPSGEPAEAKAPAGTAPTPST